jgi:hypothetical protein
MPNPVETIKAEVETSLKHQLTTGQKLLNAFKLNKFKYVWIQRIIDLSVNVWIITVDSRRPNSYLSMSKLRRLDSMIIKRAKKSSNLILLRQPKFSVPIPLEYFNGRIQSGAVLIRRDIAGEYFMNKDYYTESLKKIKII